MAKSTRVNRHSNVQRMERKQRCILEKLQRTLACKNRVRDNYRSSKYAPETLRETVSRTKVQRKNTKNSCVHRCTFCVEKIRNFLRYRRAKKERELLFSSFYIQKSITASKTTRRCDRLVGDLRKIPTHRKVSLQLRAKQINK